MPGEFGVCEVPPIEETHPPPHRGSMRGSRNARIRTRLCCLALALFLALALAWLADFPISGLLLFLDRGLVFFLFTMAK